MRKIIILIILVLLGSIVYVFVRGRDNMWICENGNWVKYGNPKTGQPDSPCTAVDKLQGELLGKTEEVRSQSKLLNTQDYSSQKLKIFPTDVLALPNTIVLRLSHNSVASIPAEIGLLINLEELYVDNNKLTGALPAEIRKMTKLTQLDASDNELTGIPAEIGQMKNLKTLDLSNNNLSTIPNELYYLKDTLKVLNVAGNKYTDDQIIDLQGKMPKTIINF